ncbi:MAG: phosphatidate cytidylyltransferase [Alphaproteobacteria bacterium]|nr:MAG: phosphatidate cytidylyltransferase [Alphaproteobacteria bacterium]
MRVLSSVVLAPLVLALTYVGGAAFAVFWTIVAALVLWEWARLTTSAGAAGPALAGWLAAGLGYAGVLLFAPLLLRRDPALGLTAMLFVFAIVWVTDIAAYFAGRAIGGPKLWPAVSPKKTWSGAVGGTLGGVAAGLLVAKLAGLVVAPMLVLVALGLAIVAQGGDLLESAIKRHFGAKDSSRLIPGHGGLMDRLDGFLTAAAAAVMVGLVRGGLEGTARGLLVW